MTTHAYRGQLLTLALALSALLSVGMSGACSRDEPPIEGPWAAEFEQALDLATTACGSRRRGPASPCSTRPPQGDEFDEHDASCQAGTLQYIEPLYGGPPSNPENLQTGDLIAQCLVRHGVVDPDYTGKDFWAERMEEVPPENGLKTHHLDGLRVCLRDPQG